MQLLPHALHRLHRPDILVERHHRGIPRLRALSIRQTEAAGYRKQSADAEQAQGPPHDTQEMGLSDAACVVYRISTGAYKDIFTSVWGTQAFAIRWPSDVETICNTPAGVFGSNDTPLALSKEDRGLANATYDQYALSITAYESSPDVSAFSSLFDHALANPDRQVLTADQQAGWELFRGKGKCNTCHLDGTENNFQTNSSGSSTTAPGNAASVAPLFTDFTSSNLGLPRNPNNPYYFQNTRDPYGFTPNPEGANFVDLGVGLFLRDSRELRRIQTGCSMNRSLRASCRYPGCVMWTCVRTLRSSKPTCTTAT